MDIGVSPAGWLAIISYQTAEGPVTIEWLHEDGRRDFATIKAEDFEVGPLVTGYGPVRG